jgi:mannose-6-phosphate isomerase-like protein (cupin superfamily)
MPLQNAQLATWSRQHAREPIQLPGDSCPSWVTRGANFVVVVSRASDGAVLERDNPDEYVLLLPDTPSLAATVDAAGSVVAGDSVRVQADSLTVVPPGKSRITVSGEGLIVRIFSSDAIDLVARADNAQTYAEPNPLVAPLVAWPDPPEGFRLRHYRLADYARGDSNMRIFRTTKLMVNPLMKRTTPRDVHKLTPHTHADFEQGSLALGGRYVHHLRYPWGPDMALWQDDQHMEMGSPSLLVVPPTVVHTSRNIGDEPGVLVDIFAPPRWDFSRKGSVCNADEYPMPPEPATATAAASK